MSQEMSRNGQGQKTDAAQANDAPSKGYTVELAGGADTAGGIVTLTLTLQGTVNTIGEAFVEALSAGIDEALGVAGLTGIIVASGHKDFCVGADINRLYAARDPAGVLEGTAALNAVYRKLETAGVPVVAALTGSALGGGYELALAAHHRVALADPRLQVGLPEVSLGVIPGAGGTQRLPYVIGLQAAVEHIAAGRPVRAPKALKLGLVDALAETPEAVMAAARAWIVAHPKAEQPWDQKRPRWPGGVRPMTPQSMQLFVGAAAFIYKKTAGCFPAAEAALRAVADGTRLSFERGLEVESRLFAALATSDQAKDMIRTLWTHRMAVEKRGVGLAHGIAKVTVLGAGMMGAGLAFVCAKAGFEVVLKDISAAALAAGEAHVAAQIKRLRHLSEAARAAVAARITATLELGPVAGSDLVIEAVVEDVAVKHAVIREVEPLLAPGGIFASNTSAIPITRLAEASAHPERFVGLHFFSPVEKMPLLEVVVPKACSDETRDRCLGFGKAIEKTNIVVNDGYGFFTSRLFAAYLMEGVQLVAEGHDPALVEWAARTAGMVMPPLKVFDEVSLTLGLRAVEGREAVTGEALEAEGLETEGLALLRRVVAAGRRGKAAGEGFYDWKTRTLWPGLKALVVAEAPDETGLGLLQRRLMVAQAAEVGRILDDGIILDRRDVEVGAVLGLGFAPNTGGPLAWMDRQGLPALVAEMDELAARYGRRYAASETLKEMAARGQRFWEAV